MSERGYGRIVNITSIHARFGEETALAYDVAKGGLEQATRTLAIELSRHGVLVNAVAPGFVATRMSIVDGKNELESEWFTDVYVKYGKLPLRRYAMPEEIAEHVAWLACDAQHLRHGPGAHGGRRRHRDLLMPPRRRASARDRAAGRRGGIARGRSGDGHVAHRVRRGHRDWPEPVRTLPARGARPRRGTPVLIVSEDEADAAAAGGCEVVSLSRLRARAARSRRRRRASARRPSSRRAPSRPSRAHWRRRWPQAWPRSRSERSSLARAPSRTRTRSRCSGRRSSCAMRDNGLPASTRSRG